MRRMRKFSDGRGWTIETGWMRCAYSNKSTIIALKRSRTVFHLRDPERIEITMAEY